MPHRTRAITPSRQAIDGALAIYTEGKSKGDDSQMLFGLSVLRSATDEEVRAAMADHESSRRMSSTDTAALFAA